MNPSLPPNHPNVPDESMASGCPALPARIAAGDQRHSDILKVGDDFPDATVKFADQIYKLDTTPVVSQIPKGGKDAKEGENWVFPSPQRYYNAMKKKGYSPREEDMVSVVSIHNTVNTRSCTLFLSGSPIPSLSRDTGAGTWSCSTKEASIRGCNYCFRNKN